MKSGPGALALGINGVDPPLDPSLGSALQPSHWITKETTSLKKFFNVLVLVIYFFAYAVQPGK